MRSRMLLTFVAVLALALAACGDDDSGDDTAERVGDTAEEVAEDVVEAADDAWASLRTNFERLVDQAATGDSEAREELLAECRDTLQDLREANDPRADRVGDVCDRIRDADDETAWDEIRQEIEDIDGEG